MTDPNCTACGHPCTNHGGYRCFTRASNGRPLFTTCEDQCKCWGHEAPDAADSARNAPVSDADGSRVHPATPDARHAVYIQFDDPEREPWYHPYAVVVDNGDGTLTVTPDEHQALEIPALIPDPRTTTEVPF